MLHLNIYLIILMKLLDLNLILKKKIIYQKTIKTIDIKKLIMNIFYNLFILKALFFAEIANVPIILIFFLFKRRI